MKVLVLGGAGYIGSVLVEDLLNSGYSVWVIDSFLYERTSLNHLFQHRKLTVQAGDIRDEKSLSAGLQWADVIIPLAALVGAPLCAQKPAEASSVNKIATLKVFKQISHDQLVLMPTTNSAYGTGQGDGFCDETSPLNPISQYAMEKVEVEKELMLLKGAVSLRLATVFGMSARMRLDLLVNDFVFRAIRDGVLVIFEGHFRRNYIHVRDVSRAMMLAIEHPDDFRGEIFNVGLSDANISKLDLAGVIKSYLPNLLIIEEQYCKDSDQRNYLVSNEKIEARGFIPQISLSAGIEELLRGLPILSRSRFGNV